MTTQKDNKGQNTSVPQDQADKAEASGRAKPIDPNTSVPQDAPDTSVPQDDVNA
ncbi:MAG: hypothetical protein ABR514_09040 [Chthoniobacterales bacterium]